DEDGERAPRRTRRHGRRSPRAAGAVGRRGRAAGCGAVKVITRLRTHTAYRFGSRTLRIAAAILAVTIVATLTVDLGPAVRGWAEREGSKQLKRPIHIGGLHIHLLTGVVTADRFSIDGLQPGDRPFFNARQIDVSLNWATLLRKEVTIESVKLTDWQMIVEK